MGRWHALVMLVRASTLKRYDMGMHKRYLEDQNNAAMWRDRQKDNLARQRSGDVIDGEYTVIEDAPQITDKDDTTCAYPKV